MQTQTYAVACLVLLLFVSPRVNPQVGEYSLHASQQNTPPRQTKVEAAKDLDKFLNDLRSKDRETRRVAASKLIDIGLSAILPLEEFLITEKGDARVYAASTLVEINRTNPKALKVLTDAVQLGRGDAMLEAAEVLAEIDPDGDVTVAPLTKQAEKFILIPTSENIMTQRRAAYILGMTAPGVRALAKLLRHYDSWVRQAAVFALDDRTETLNGAPASIQEAIKECIPPLVEDLGDKDRIVREMAGEDLEQIGPDAIPFLKKEVAGSNKKLSLEATAVLAAIEKNARHDR